MSVKVCLLSIVFVFSVVLFAHAERDVCEISEFEKLAGRLPLAETASVLQLADVFQKSAGLLPVSCKEKMFVRFWDFYHKSLAAYQDAANVWSIPYPMPVSDRKNLDAGLSAVGWEIRESEGMYYVGETPAWLYEHFASDLPESWQKYLLQRKCEIEEGFTEDAALVISWEQLRRRIIFWENFMRTYTGFPLTADIADLLQSSLLIYLHGLDNSPVADYTDGNRIRDEVRKSYETFLQHNRASKFYDPVKGYYDIIRRNNFVVSVEAEDYLSTFERATLPGAIHEAQDSPHSPSLAGEEGERAQDDR